MDNTQKLVFIETLGCQMNKSDSEKILGILATLGYEQTQDPKHANLLIINTCNIREMSKNKAYSYLGKWGQMKEHSNIKIGICGCVAQQDAFDVFKRAPYVDLVFGTHNIYELPNLLKRLETEENVCTIRKSDYTEGKDNFFPKRAKGYNAWIPIIEGCDYFCTYCVVPYVRGRQRSRLPEEIIKEAKKAIAQGYPEITLLGQTVDSYGRDLNNPNITLASLLRQIHELEGLKRLRFTTSYPTDITDELIQAVKELPKVCKYFHIPMQSGSTEVLKRMKRRYTKEEYLEIVNKIRSQVENVTITSDFIVGFPGETQEQFEETMNILDEAQLDYSNTASYSPRKQTPAATWRDDFIPENIKKERLKTLNEKVKANSKLSNEKYIGKVLEVLVDEYKEEQGVISGKSQNEKIVHAKGSKDLLGEMVKIKITTASHWCIKGEII